MTKKTKAEIIVNNNFLPFYVADKLGKTQEWYKYFRKVYRKLICKEIK